MLIESSKILAVNPRLHKMKAGVKSFNLRPRSISQDMSIHSYTVDSKFRSSLAPRYLGSGEPKRLQLSISRFTAEITFKF